MVISIVNQFEYDKKKEEEDEKSSCCDRKYSLIEFEKELRFVSRKREVSSAVLLGYCVIFPSDKLFF